MVCQYILHILSRTDFKGGAAISKAVFEVETRFRFTDQDEAYQVLPFLETSLNRKIEWSTAFYGQDILLAGKMLRKSEVKIEGNIRHFICWKGPDTGTLINIRQEVSEEVTTGITDSCVMSILDGPTDLETPNQAVKELERLGHARYMSFTGTDIYGYYKPLEIRVKLMLCDAIKWPFVLEFEKIAETKEQAAQFENDIIKICDELQLRDRMIREEPPTLLYERAKTEESGNAGG